MAPIKKQAAAKPAAKKQAAKPAAPKTEKLPARKAAEVVLLQNGAPMHYREITKQAIENGLVRVKKGKRKVDEGATMKTIRSYLCAEEGARFVRVDTGIFDLTDKARKELSAKKS